MNGPPGMLGPKTTSLTRGASQRRNGCSSGDALANTRNRAGGPWTIGQHAQQREHIGKPLYHIEDDEPVSHIIEKRPPTSGQWQDADRFA